MGFAKRLGYRVTVTTSTTTITATINTTTITTTPTTTAILAWDHSVVASAAVACGRLRVKKND